MCAELVQEQQAHAETKAEVELLKMENDALRTKVAAHSRERSQSTLVMYEDLLLLVI